MSKQVLHLDPNPAARASLRGALKTSDKLVLAGSVATTGKALVQLAQIRPALLVLELDLRATSGLGFVKTVRSGFETSVLIRTRRQEPHYARRALQAGAKGYLLSKEEPNLLREAVSVVLAGGRWVSSAVWAKSTGSSEEKPLPVSDLSNREVELLRLMGEGLSISDIATALRLPAATIRRYRSQIEDKLHCGSGELVRWSRRWATRPDSRGESYGSVQLNSS